MEEHKMNEWKLQRALENKDDGLTDKAIRARLSRARRAERLLCEDLDHIVMDDDRMCAALIALKNCSSERSGGLQNALRWYYRAVNGSEFPRLSDFCPARRVGTAPLSQNSVPAQAKHLSPIAGSHMPLSAPETSVPLGDLWREYCDVKNRITVSLGRTANIVGELAERIVADYHSAALLGPSHPSADVRLGDGTLLQVKARMLTGHPTTSLSAIRSWNFDLLAVILFSPEGDVAFGGEIPCSAAQRHAKETPHVNGWTITTSQEFLNDPELIALTDEYQNTLGEL